MDEKLLSGIGFLVAGIAAIIVFLVLLAILKFVVKFTTSTVTILIKAIVRLLFSTLLDLRFTGMLSVIFCMIAEREPAGNWPALALTVSASAFVLTVFNIGYFLITSYFVRKVQDAGNAVVAEESARRSIDDWALAVQLNVGFLGLIFLALSFSSLGYSYYLACNALELPEYQWVRPDDGDTAPPVLTEDTPPDSEPLQAGYSVFFKHTGQIFHRNLPELIRSQLAPQPVLLQPSRKAVGMRVVELIFGYAVWGALLALFSALLLPRRIFRSL